MGKYDLQQNIKRLINIQNLCVHLIGQNPNRYPTQQLYKDERLLPLESLICVELCKFGHHVATKELLRPLLDLLDSQGGWKTHRYQMQNKKTPNIQKHSGIHFNKSLQSIIKRY